MPPVLALVLSLGFIAVLFVRDAQNNARADRALWLPVAWMAIAGSRFFSQWLQMLGFDVPDAGHSAEGSTFDAVCFLALILSGVAVLARRRVSLAVFLQNNAWLGALLIYCLVSIVWSEFPFVSFKRWIKVMGHPVMALIILTDANPAQALRTVLKRCTFLLVPISILLIKYYPEFGRAFDPFTGKAFNTGVGTQKNDLGYTSMIFGLFFMWNLLTLKRFGDLRNRREELGLSLLFLLLIGWLLKQSDSATSFSILLLGSVVMLVLGLRVIDKRAISVYVLAAILLAVGAELTFNVYEVALQVLGRNPTLTDRTLLWADVLQLQNSPLFGAGFESFWLSPRLEELYAKWWWRPTQSHNGYIETYLNLGLIGVMLLCVSILAAFLRISRRFPTEFDWARIRLVYLLAVCAFNYTEAGFTGVHFVWTVFFIIALQYPRRRASAFPLASAATGTYPRRSPLLNASSSPPMGEPVQMTGAARGKRAP